MNCWRQQSQTHPGDDDHLSLKQAFSENADNKSHKSVKDEDDSLGLDMINRSDLDSSEPLRRYMRTISGDYAHKGSITSVAVIETDPMKSASRKLGAAKPLLVTASEDGTARLWDLFSGQWIRTFPDTAAAVTPKKLLSVAAIEFDKGMMGFTCEGMVAVTGCEDASASVWDINTGGRIHHLTGLHTKGISTIMLVVAEGMPLAALGSQDKGSSVWNLATGKPLYKFSDKWHTDLLLSMTLFCPMKSNPKLADLTFITASWDKTVRFWKLSGGKPLESRPEVMEVTPVDLLTGHTKSVTAITAHDAMVVGRDGSVRSYPVLVTGSLDKTAIIWDYHTKDKIHVLKGHTEKLTAVDVYVGHESNAPVVFTASDDKTIILWDMMSGAAVRTLQFTSKIFSMIVLQHQNGIVLVSGGDDKLPTTWNLTRSERIRKLKTIGNVTGIGAYDPRGDEPDVTKVLIADVLNKTNVFDLHRHKAEHKPHEITAHKERLNSLIVHSPKNKSQPASFITCSADSIIKVWDMHSHDCRSELAGHVNLVFALALYDPDKCHPSIPANYPELSKPLIISGGLDKHIRFWDFSVPGHQTENKNSIPDAHKSLVRALTVYHPLVEGEDPLLVSGSYDLTAKIWNMRTREPLFVLKGHKEFVFLVNVYDPVLHMGKDAAEKRGLLAPLLVTGSYDKTCIVWDMRTGEQVRMMEGHKDSVTAQDLYTPRNPRDPPLLITGSIDRLVIIWNLWTGERLQTLVGHTDRVCCISVYQPRDPNAMPFILSGGDDKCTIVWEDALYSTSYMPLRDAVNRIFHADLDGEDWPLITEFASKYKLAFFMENPNLYYLAIKHKRPDFLLKFRMYLGKCLCSMKDFGGKSLLEYALHRSDLISVRAILLSWIQILNTDIKDLLTQNVFHPAYFFLSLKELVPLSKKYPLEYQLFLSSVRLVRDHSSLLQNVTELSLSAGDRYEIAGTNDRAGLWKDVWAAHFHTNKIYKLVELAMEIVSRAPSAQQPVTSLFLPIRHPVEMQDGFNVFADVCDQLQDVEIFNSAVGIYSVTYFWQTQGRAFHVKNFIRYLLFLGLFVLCVYAYQFYYSRGRFLLADLGMNAHIIIMILVMLYYVYEEYRQIKNSNPVINWKVVLEHFLRDLWNVVDIVIPLTGLTGLGVLIALQELSPTARCFLATCSIFMWFKVLYFLRPFANSGPLVVMILRIAHDIRFFLLVLFCVLCGFAQGFWLLSNVDPELEFGTVRNSLLTTFMYMLGNVDSATFEGTVAPGFATLLLVFFLIFMMILMLNLLIALMGDTFSTVRSQGTALWRKEQTAILSEQSFLMSNITTHDYIHVLKYTSDLDIRVNEPEDKLLESVEESAPQAVPFTPFEEPAEQTEAVSEVEEVKNKLKDMEELLQKLLAAVDKK